MQNPAEDITHGKTLQELAEPNRWNQGPPFLLTDPDEWLTEPASTINDPLDPTELCKLILHGVSPTTDTPVAKDLHQCNTCQELLEASAQEIHRAASKNSRATVEEYWQAQTRLFKKAQQDSFLDKFHLLKEEKNIYCSRHLLTLTPELDTTGEFIQVGCRLHQCKDLTHTSLYPLEINPSHLIMPLLTQDFGGLPFQEEVRHLF